MAGKTPAERNRYVDFLRAVSILPGTCSSLTRSIIG
jgi:hypothetical protein